MAASLPSSALIGVGIFFAVLAGLYTFGVWRGARERDVTRGEVTTTFFLLTVLCVLVYLFANSFLGVLFLAVGAGIPLLAFLSYYSGRAFGRLYAYRPGVLGTVLAALGPAIIIAIPVAIEFTIDQAQAAIDRSRLRPPVTVQFAGQTRDILITPRTRIVTTDGRIIGYDTPNADAQIWPAARIVVDSYQVGPHDRALVLPITPPAPDPTRPGLQIAPPNDAFRQAIFDTHDKWCAIRLLPAKNTFCYSQPVALVSFDPAPHPDVLATLESGTPVTDYLEPGMRAACGELAIRRGAADFDGRELPCVALMEVEPGVWANVWYYPADRALGQSSIIFGDVTRYWQALTNPANPLP